MNLEAEQNLLGMAMLDQNCAIKLLEIPENWFSLSAHITIYRQIGVLMANSMPIDMVSLGDSIIGTSKQIEGLDMEYLNTLCSTCTIISHFDSYKDALFRIYKKKSIQNVADCLNRQLQGGEEVLNIITGLQDSVFDLLTDHNTGGFKSIKSFCKEAVDDLIWQNENPNKMMGQKTGFRQLDETIHGFEKGKVYVLAARPAMGKTQFALNLALRISLEAPSLFFSLEMTGKGLAKRMMSNVADLDGRLMNGATMQDEQWTSLTQAVTTLEGRHKIFIDETPGLSTAQMRARAKAEQLKQGSVGSIMFDHIGLIAKNPRKSETEALTQIVHELAAMAKEFDCPVIELSQLNREVEKRPDKRPMLSDLKQTSAIEEDARVVMFLYRDEYYNEDSEMRGITELIIAKNSDGATKTLYFNHDMSKAKYEQNEMFSLPKQQKKSKGKF